MSELKAETIVPQGCTITLQMYPKAEADKVIAHHKYKRCLAMATFCHVSSVLCEGPDSLFYRRWFHKWHELAEKFKPNN